MSAGEAEDRFDELLRDVLKNRLAPICNFMSDLPAMDSQPLYIRSCVETARTYTRAAWFFARLERLRRRLEKDTAVKQYRGLAMAPCDELSSETLALYDTSDLARAAAQQARARRERLQNNLDY